MVKNDSETGDPSMVEQLRAKRKNLAERIQTLLAELESAEHEFDAISKEMERLSKEAHGL